MKHVAHHTLRWTLLLVFSLLVLTAVVTGAARISFPFLGQYRAEIERYVSQRLDNPVEIGALELSWHGVGPRLVLEDVMLVSGVERGQDVQIDEILLDLDLFRSWLNGGWQIREMAIVGVDLSVEYLGSKKIRAYGHQIDGEKSGGAQSVDVLGWLMSADSVALLDSRIHLIDKHKRIDVQLRDLNIRARNNAGLHQLRLDARVPGISAGQVSLSVDFSGARPDLLKSNGQFHLHTDNLNLASLFDLQPDIVPLSVAGVSDLQLWGAWSQVGLQSLRLLSDTRDVLLENPAADARWQSRQVQADIVVKRQDDSMLVGVRELSVGEMSDASSLIEGYLRVANEQDKRLSYLDLRGPEIDLAALSSFARVWEGLPLAESWMPRMKALAPTGKIEDWAISLDQTSAKPRFQAARATFNNVGVQAYAKLPGVSSFDGQLTLQNNRGEIVIDDDAFRFMMPRWFRQPIDARTLDGRVAFEITPDGFEIQSSPIRVASEHVDGSVQFQVRKRGQSPAWLDLQASVEKADAAHIHLYYPTGRMHPALVKWLDEAFIAGDLSEGELHLSGPTKGFPYADGSGEFSARIRMDDGQLKYLDGWPEGQALQARVRFDRDAISFDVSDGVVAGNRLSTVNGSIASLKQADIALHATLLGDSENLMEFVQQSPLDGLLEPVLGGSTLEGGMGVSIELGVPLKQFSVDKIRVKGELDLAGNRWYSPRFGFDLEKLRGRVHFSERDLVADVLSAEYFGKPVRIRASRDEQDPSIFTRVSVEGNIDAEQVLRNYKLPLAHRFQGDAPWQFLLTAQRGEQREQGMTVALQATSKLLGTEVNLPMPLQLASRDALDVSVNAVFEPKSSHTLWRVTYGDRLHAKARIRQSDQRLDALALGFGQQPPADANLEPGIHFSGEASRLSFDGWIDAISEIIASLPESEEKTPAMPVSGTVATDNLIIGKVNAGAARLRAVSNAGFITTGLVSRWLVGDIHYPRVYWQGKAVKSNLTLLNKQFIDALATAEGEGERERLDPRQLPPLDVTIEKFIWDVYRVSDMRVKTQPETDGMVTEMLGFMHDHLEMAGSAEWRVRESADASEILHHTDIRFRLQSDDVGRGLDRVGMGEAFADGRGYINVDLSWEDAAYAPSFDEIQGSIQSELSDGRIIAVEPGAAKILGLFALQAVPRRLLLDFDDVTNDGLLYDSIRGQIDIANGIAETRYMQMQGPIGVVYSQGSTDFVSSTYDQTITVLPRLSATLPIIGLISGGATAGVGVLVVDQVLKGLGINFDEVGKREYRLTGSWDDPVMKRIHVPFEKIPEPDVR